MFPLFSASLRSDFFLIAAQFAALSITRLPCGAARFDPSSLGSHRWCVQICQA